jgi:hypothetical protein
MAVAPTCRRRAAEGATIGVMKPMRAFRPVLLAALGLALVAPLAAQSPAPAPVAQSTSTAAGASAPGTASRRAAVHFIWMGGNDCPPCVAWRAEQLPKLEKTAVFRTVLFSYAPKSIKSTVPPRLFLPEAVKPYKEKLDAASAGRSGSPQAALLVDGQVFDYFFGARSAEDLEEMLLAARDGGKYPFPRCLRLQATGRGCAVKG